MEEILHQLRLVFYPIIYKVLPPSQVVGLGISEPSTVPSTLKTRTSQWYPSIKPFKRVITPFMTGRGIYLVGKPQETYHPFGSNLISSPVLSSAQSFARHRKVEVE